MTVKSSTWSLKLSDLSSNDFGNFSCQASNSLGTARGYSGVTGELSLNLTEKIIELFCQCIFWKFTSKSVIISGKPSQLVFTSPSLNHNLAHYNLTWRTESVSTILAYKLIFKLAKVTLFFIGIGWHKFSIIWRMVEYCSSGSLIDILVPFYTFPFIKSEHYGPMYISCYKCVQIQSGNIPCIKLWLHHF